MFRCSDGLSSRTAARPVGAGFGLGRWYAARLFRGCLALSGDDGSAVIENLRVFAINRDAAERMEGFPRDSRRVSDPILV